MRNITSHIVEGDSANHQLTITVTDEPGAGGANHNYLIEWRDKDGNRKGTHVSFQNGPIIENGVNGITQEALLAIVADRLWSFQAGPFACEANSLALMCCNTALFNLQSRTRERIARGVEGTTQK